MSANINLVGNKGPIDPRLVRLAKVRKISFVILFVLLFISIVLFLTNLRLSTNSLRNEQDKVVQELSTYDLTAAKIFLLNARVRDISGILEKRSTYSEILEKSVATVSVGVVDLQVQGDLFTVSVASDSLVSLNEFLNSVLELSDGKKLSNVSMDSLIIDNGIYTMTVKAKIL